MGFLEYLAGNWTEVLGATTAHAVLVLEGLGLAVLIGVPVAVVVYRTDALRAAVLGATALLLTIPSYALFGLLIAPLGLGNAPSIVALTMYALLPVVRRRSSAPSSQRSPRARNSCGHIPKLANSPGESGRSSPKRRWWN